MRLAGALLAGQDAHAAPPSISTAGRAETVRRYASEPRQGVAVGPEVVMATA